MKPIFSFLKYFSLGKIIILFFSLTTIIVFSSCKGNKEKLVGRWQVANVYVHDPEWDELWKDNAALDQGGQTNAVVYDKMKAIQDSLTNIRKAEHDMYKKMTYQFNDDGSVQINCSDKELKGNWELIEDSENLLVIIKENDKTSEQWQMSTEVFKTPLFEQDTEFDADMNIGGGSFNNSGKRYYVSLVLKGMQSPTHR